MIEVPVSWGELIDKITILEIKAERIADAQKRLNVAHELALLQAKLSGAPRHATLAQLTDGLKAVNAALWEVEDAIRDCERAGDFGAGFIELARKVYHQNDIRASLKRQINLALGSDIIEENRIIPIEIASAREPSEPHPRRVARPFEPARGKPRTSWPP